jgi:hypothetical protein
VAPFLQGKWKPSNVLSSLDPEAYKQQRDEWIEQGLNDGLGSGSPYYEVNRSRFDLLSEVVCKGRVVPFVGAGMSCRLGFPSWCSFLLELAEEKGVSSRRLKQLLDDDEYESVASTLAESVGRSLFQEYFDRKFRVRAETPVDAANDALLQLTSGAVVTTNYDQVLETLSGKSFAVFNGMQPGQFLRRAREGQRVLLKIHGDLKIPKSVVLLASDYEREYGPSGRIDLNRPLSQLLRALFLSHTMLFVGCRLANDRTMALLKAISNDEIWDVSHYAIIEAGEESVRIERERYLAERRIFPIWYRKEAHAHVAILLEELMRRRIET